MESVLVNIQDFTLNGSDQVCDGACFYLHVIFSKAYQVFTMNCSDGVCDGEPVFISICGSMILVKLQVLNFNGRDGICDRACSHPHAVVLCF